MQFPDEIIIRIREATDLIELAKEYFTLKASGRNYKAHCTHPGGDRTPSLTFFPDSQQFRCFSCNVGAKTHPVHNSGDVFGFIGWMEGLDFPGSVRFLANRVGIEIPEEQRNPEMDQLYRTMLQRNRDYWDNLQADPTVRAWYKSRGIEEESITKFRLGAYLHEPVYAIQDVTGSTASFVFRREDENPKYRNEPNTAIFTKGKSLYGLFHAKPLIRKQGFCFLVEGYNDVIILHQAGYPVVGYMGSCLTREQAELITKYTKSVVLFPDGDTAGIEGIRSNAKVLQEFGAEVEVLFCSGFDPDEIVLRHGSNFNQFFQDNRQFVFQYALERILSQYRDRVLRLKQGALQEINSWVDDIQDPTQKELMTSTILAAFRREP